MVSLTTPTLCEVWKSAAIHSINPTLQLRNAPNTHTHCMALSGTGSWTTNPWHLRNDEGEIKGLFFTYSSDYSWNVSVCLHVSRRNPRQHADTQTPLPLSKSKSEHFPTSKYEQRIKKRNKNRVIQAGKLDLTG